LEDYKNRNEYSGYKGKDNIFSSVISEARESQEQTKALPRGRSLYSIQSKNDNQTRKSTLSDNIEDVKRCEVPLPNIPRSLIQKVFGSNDSQV
jgi:hypothetical protein